MFILGIETTCDETGIALIEINKEENKVKILKNELSSQVKIHQKYGGVVPILAAREHKKNLPFLLKRIEDDFDLRKIEFLSFSSDPGLLPALVAGKEFVQELSKKLNKKIMPVNHLMGHFYSVALKNISKNWQKIKDIKFPSLSLIISGGHTILYLFKNSKEKRILGQTLDDAVGEVLDKCARALGLPYPGGPEIEKRSKLAKNFFSLPKPVINQNYRFSFSGLKTAFIDLVDEIKKLKKLDEQTINNLCASLQKTIFEILVYKLKKTEKDFKIKNFVITGGVTANQKLREIIKKNFPDKIIYFPHRKLSTDNGLNIAIAGYFYFKNGEKLIDSDKLEVFARI